MDREKDYDERFKEWKKTHKRGSWKDREIKGDVRQAKDDVDLSFLKGVEKKAEGVVEGLGEGVGRTVEEVEREIEEVEKRIEEYGGALLSVPQDKEFGGKPMYVRVLRVLAVLIPVAIILYLVSANFLVAQDFEYVYDIGSSESEGHLTPAERISEVVFEGEENYRELTGHLVYFDVPVARGAERVSVRVRIGDNFPEDGKISLGARNDEEWSYFYKNLYNPGLDVGGYDFSGRVYRLNENLEVVDEAGLAGMEGITIASNSYEPVVNEIDDYSKEETEIELSLRGKHEFYVYAEEYLEVYVEKQDINWYEGSDELIVVLYDLDGRVVELLQLGDDGVVDDSKEREAKQSGTLRAGGLAEGVYRLEFSDFDGLITKIRVNSNKIVADKVFLADNEIYGVDTKPSRLYFDYDKIVKMRFITYHEAGLQRILFNKNGGVSAFNFDIEDEPVFREVSAGSYMVTFQKNDLVVESPEYFAFTEDGYFRPWKQKVVSVNSPEWIMDSVDYLITDYVAPEREGDWMIVETEFDLEEDGLWVNEQGELSLVFNVPHLGQEGSNYTIPVDWIKVQVHKPGVWDE